MKIVSKRPIDNEPDVRLDNDWALNRHYIIDVII